MRAFVLTADYFSKKHAMAGFFTILHPAGAGIPPVGHSVRLILHPEIIRIPNSRHLRHVGKAGKHIAKPLHTASGGTANSHRGQNELKTTEVLRENRRYR
jgi:hypothetical protein